MKLINTKSELLKITEDTTEINHKILYQKLRIVIAKLALVKDVKINIKYIKKDGGIVKLMTLNNLPDISYDDDFIVAIIVQRIGLKLPDKLEDIDKFIISSAYYKG
jgi:hypothetical protein